MVVRTLRVYIAREVMDNLGLLAVVGVGGGRADRGVGGMERVVGDCSSK